MPSVKILNREITENSAMVPFNEIKEGHIFQVPGVDLQGDWLKALGDVDEHGLLRAVRLEIEFAGVVKNSLTYDYTEKEIFILEELPFFISAFLEEDQEPEEKWCRVLISDFCNGNPGPDQHKDVRELEKGDFFCIPTEEPFRKPGEWYVALDDVDFQHRKGKQNLIFVNAAIVKVHRIRKIEFDGEEVRCLMTNSSSTRGIEKQEVSK